MSDIIETIFSNDGKRRVLILCRPDGSFGYTEEYHYRNDLAEVEGWASLPTNTAFFGSLEIARRELPFNVSWLAGERHAAQQDTQHNPSVSGDSSA
jgi:hypothetical protein